MQNAIYIEINDEQAENNMKKAKEYKNYIYEDARSYKSAMERNDYNKAVSEAEQVGEKSLKAIAQKNGRLSTTMKQRHGHDLKYLARECGAEIKTPDDDLDKLSKGYFSARYPEGKKKYNKDEAEKCGKIACEVMDQLIEELDIPDQELNKEIGGKEEKENIDDFKSWNRLMK